MLNFRSLAENRTNYEKIAKSKRSCTGLKIDWFYPFPLLQESLQTAGFASSRNESGLGVSKAGLCGDVLTWLRSEAQRKVCAAPQFVSWVWDALQGVPAGEWAGLASALGAGHVGPEV